MDRFSPEKRSWLMSRVKATDTGPELAVRACVSAMGIRYRLHVSQLPGKPDLVFRARKKVIFVHGCFWHMHKGCGKCTFPKTRRIFWARKLSGNRQRDVEVLKKLRRAGWKALTVWECEIRDVERLRRKLDRFLVS